MGTSVDRLSILLLDGTIAATLLLGLVALVMVSSGQPARRLTIGRMGIVGSLAIIPLAMFAPVPEFRVHLPLSLDALSTFSFKIPLRAAPLLPGRLLVAAVVIGMCVGVLAVVMGWIGCFRWLSRTVEPAPETSEVLGNLPFDGPGIRPNVRVSARVRRPVLIGTFLPTILIPPDLEEPDQTEPLRLGLLHEMAHAERFDPVFGLLGNIAASIWFFVPPLWWVRRQMRLDQEFLADRRASARFGSGSSYASSLVGLADLGGPSAPAAQDNASSEGASVSALFQRILMLIRCPYPVESKAPRWWVAAWLVLIGGGTLFAAGLAIRPRTDGWSTFDPKSGKVPKHGAFHVARLMVDAREAASNGCVPPYTLLQVLPEQFEFVAEVWAEPAELAEMAIAGRRLGPVPMQPSEAPLATGYHKVRIVRGPNGFQLWVANRVIPPNRLDIPPTRWLELVPAVKRPGRYRNIVLSW